MGTRLVAICAVVGMVALAATTQASPLWPDYEENGISAEEILLDIHGLANAASEPELAAMALDAMEDAHWGSMPDAERYDHCQASLAYAQAENWSSALDEIDHGGGG